MNREITPPSSPVIIDGDVFKSPASSMSGESGIVLKDYGSSISGESGVMLKDYGPISLRHPSIQRYPQNRVSDISIESFFNDNSLKHTRFDKSGKTAWETVYAIQEGRKLVKPTFRGSVYNFLERPREWKAVLYHCVVFLVVLVCLIFSILTSVAENETYAEAQYSMEIILVIFLSIEYVARLWSAGCRSKYLGLWGRLRFATKPISILDLVIIVASFFVIIFGSNGHVFATSAYRGVRFLQILRMLHMDRQGGSWRLLGSVMYMHRQELMTSMYIGFLGLIFSSYFMYLVEKDTFVNNEPSDFNSYADALWWGVVTMMTIGYGDKVPHTWAGRALACISAMFTVSFFALPAGILGSGFALKVQQQQRQKHFSRQIPAAATLIQCLWRCYAADKKFNSVATWNMYINRNTNNNTPSKFKQGGLRLRRGKGKNADGNRMSYGDNIKHRGESFGEIAVELGAPRHGLSQSRSVPDMILVMQEENTYPNSKGERNSLVFHSPTQSICDTIYDEAETESQDSCLVTTLTENYKNAIRAIRKIKYFVAKRKFQQARKPYDVGDVIEQYSQGQLSMMVRIKELQRRLDQMLGKPNNSWGDKTGKPVTIGNKLHQLENQIQRLDKKMENLHSAIQSLVKELSNKNQEQKNTE